MGLAHRVALGSAVVSALALAAPSGALAGSVVRRDRGGVKAQGLSRAERRALDIRSVTAAGGGFGLVVKVRFKGNIERALGRGRLGHAAVALVLRPKRGRGSPAVLAASGRGTRAKTL